MQAPYICIALFGFLKLSRNVCDLQGSHSTGPIQAALSPALGVRCDHGQAVRLGHVTHINGTQKVLGVPAGLGGGEEP